MTVKEAENSYELIAKQQIQIEEQKEQLNELFESMRKIDNALFCIGGPLNDNKLQFNHKQKVYLQNHIDRHIILKPREEDQRLNHREVSDENK